MRKFLGLFVAVLLLSSVVAPHKAQAEMPVKAKAFLTIVGYGTASGALLGAASMAFGNSTRAVAQGASLGLYAGILFGAYVLVSHHNKRYGNYDDQNSPYQQSSEVYGDEYQSDDGGSNSGEASKKGFFDRFEVLQEKFHGQAFTLGAKEKGTKVPPIHVNLFQYNF